MKIEFKEKQTLGGGWSLEVWKAPAVIGHIRKSASTGRYRYFNGPQNELTPSLGDDDPNELKQKVTARYQNS